MPSGIVLWFNSEKGYGYIKAEDGSELFVREHRIKSEGFRILKSNEKVTYEIDLDSDTRGPQAKNVEVIS
jgi:CspA family cold shock protein